MRSTRWKDQRGFSSEEVDNELGIHEESASRVDEQFHPKETLLLTATMGRDITAVHTSETVKNLSGLSSETMRLTLSRWQVAICVTA